MLRPEMILAAALALLPTSVLAQGSDAAAADRPPEAPAETAPAPWLTTLITDTPQQGFDLAITLARRAVKTTQPDVEVLKTQRPIYAGNADSLIEVSGVAAAWFATVAAANDYWRE